MRWALVAVLCIAAGSSVAQVTGQIGTGTSGVFSGGPDMGITGAATGINGGALPPPDQCPNQLVLDYSNSCALIAQAWGQ